jgi:Protein of unknown function (DUF2808)
MKKSLVYAVIRVIAAMLFIPSGYASAKDDNGTFPHVYGNSQFPQTKWSNIRHSLRVHIPKNSPNVSQISIAVPETVRWSNKISDVVVTGNNGEKVKTNISINEKTILLIFNKPLSPNNNLEIDINNVKQPISGNGHIYHLFVQSPGSNSNIPIGIARFRVNL